MRRGGSAGSACSDELFRAVRFSPGEEGRTALAGRKTFSILFDLDDTLIHCNKYFDEVIERFASYMMEWFGEYGLTKQEVKEKQLELDLAGIAKEGFTAERFPESFAETYDYFCRKTGRPCPPAERAIALELGYSVYDSDFELYPGVVDTLFRLQAEGHTLSLFTGGVARIQKSKVEKVNLGPFFEDRIHVARHKNAEALDAILTENGFDRSMTWMVGNSLRTDIAPALECGIGAIYIPPLSNWAYDMTDLPKLEPSERFLALDSIGDVPDALAKFR